MIDPSANRATLDALHTARRAEKDQALFYRGLAASAEAAHNAQEAEDLNGLHADEQHHLSRITVRLVELNEQVADLSTVTVEPPPYPDWRPVAREREKAEIRRYEKLQALGLDASTGQLIAEILDSERQHVQSLGGKYMSAFDARAESES
jgi:rubrerythrin